MTSQEERRAKILGKEIGEWHNCAICYARRLASSFEKLTYFIPTIRVNREIYYCKDNPWCVYKAKERGKIPARV